MIPKEVYLIEWQDETWSVEMDNPDDLDWPFLGYKPNNVYKIEIDWRLLEKEGHIRGAEAVPSSDEGDSVE